MASLKIKTTALILGSMIVGGIISVGVYAYFASAHQPVDTAPASEKEARKVQIGRAHV